MALKLRLKRVGRTHRAVFRLSAMDGRCPRDGRTVEELGQYDPANRDPAKQVAFDAERVKFWLGRGAQPTETVRNLLKKQGLL